MNVLYVSLSYPPSIGGGEIHLHRLAKEIERQGHRVRVVTQWSRSRSDWVYGATTRSDPARAYEHEGVPVTQLGFRPATRMRMLPWAVAYRRRVLRGTAIRRISALMRPYFAAAAGGRVDLVHAVRMGPEFLPLTALLHSRRIGAPFVITALHHPDWTGPRHRHYAHIYRAADAVIALTEFEKKVLVEDKGVLQERIHVTGIGPVLAPSHSVERFRERFGIRGPYVLFVGRKVPHKGWAAILAASPRVFERFPEVELVFVGEDGEASREAFAAQQDPRIRNLGPVDLQTKTDALAGCLLLCLPSTSESFGGVTTEAWALGKPVIAGKIPPVAEIVDDGVDGLLSTQDPGELAGKIVRLLDHPEQAARMGEAGRRKVEERYGWDRLAAATLLVYESVLRGSAPAREDRPEASSTHRTR
jgi:glycosyltransferase involved in cell wall biosynthesis